MKRKANLDIICDNSPEMKDVIVNEKGGRIKFTKEFVHPDLIVNYIIDDTTDALSRMNKASREVVTLKCV